jgi:hypothetical protein
MFCTPRLIFNGTEGVPSHFHVFRSRTCFRRYRGRRFPFSGFALPNSFSAVPTASDPVFTFCAPGLVFGGIRGVGSHFLILSPQTHFRRCLGCRVRFSCFALPDSFSAVPGASDPVFMFCVLVHVFGATEGVGSRFHVLRSLTRFQRYQGRRSHFLVLRARTHFRRFRELRVPFSCFARPNSFSAVPRASGPVLMLCAPGLVFGGSGGVVCRFLVLRPLARLRRCRGRPVPFSCFALPNSFSDVPRASCFSCFAPPDSFSAVSRASCPVFMFCAPGLIFGGTEGVPSLFHVSCPGHVFGGTDGVSSRFQVLRSLTRFRRYRQRPVPFSRFALPDSFFGGIGGVRSRFLVLHARTRFRRFR